MTDRIVNHAISVVFLGVVGGLGSAMVYGAWVWVLSPSVRCVL